MKVEMEGEDELGPKTLYIISGKLSEIRGDVQICFWKMLGRLLMSGAEHNISICRLCRKPRMKYYNVKS